MRAGWLGEDDHRGWRGVTDPKHVLIAVSFEPVEGSLACRMCNGEDRIHLAVPERLYRILLRSPYAGAYYRKYIARQFLLLNPPEAKPFRSAELYAAIAAKGKILRRKRLVAAEHPETNLFGEAIPGPTRKRRNG